MVNLERIVQIMVERFSGHAQITWKDIGFVLHLSTVTDDWGRSDWTRFTFLLGKLAIVRTD